MSLVGSFYLFKLIIWIELQQIFIEPETKKETFTFPIVGIDLCLYFFVRN